MKAGVILNPVAGGGGLMRQRAVLEAALARHFEQWEIRETQATGDGEHLALGLAADGFDLLIAAGGDGTANEVADGLVQYRAEHGTAPHLAFLPCGTGTDFARGLGLSRDITATVARIANATPRMVDAGKASYDDDEGALASRHFLNISSLGLSGPVNRAVNKDKRKGRMSAKLLFLLRTVQEFIRYKFQTVRIRVDGGEPIEARVALVAMCNGRYFGGGMMIGPDAELDDGKFDVVIVRAAGKLGLLWDLRLLYTGAHRNHHAISIARGSRVEVEAVSGGDIVQVEADGEVLGRCPATFEVLPGVISLKV